MSLNVVNLVGRAGIDPDVKYFESGSVVCRLTLAVDRGRKDSPPDWFEVKLWGKQAEVAANWVRKGKLLGITGTLQIEQWQDRNTGQPRSKPVIRASNLKLLGSKRDDEASMSSYEEF